MVVICKRFERNSGVRYSAGCAGGRGDDDTDYSNCDNSINLANFCANCQRENTLAETLFDYCEDCQTMAAIPQGAFAVYKIRAQNDNKNLTVARVKTGADSKPDNRLYPNKKLMDYTPVKYNSKFMNAIWGHYNRYSPHNMKSNDVDLKTGYCQQQPCAVAGHAIVNNLTMKKDVWEFKY